MTCLITGVAGFIGSTLAERLLELGHDVVGIDCFTDFYSAEMKKANLRKAASSPGFRLVRGDLAEMDIKSLLEGADYVFHQAAQPGVRGSWGANFATYLRNNVLATQKLLEAAKGSGIRRIVYASSSSVYGDSPELPLRETARPEPVSPYGVTKLAAEHLCQLYYVNYAVPVVSLRYFTVYGPRQRPDMAFHRFIKSALRGEEITIYGDGEQTRDFTYISDAVTANILAAETPIAVGRVFNIGGGSRVSINAILETLEGLTGGLNVRYAESQKGDVRHTMSDTSAAHKALGYKPEVGIREGLARQVEWMKCLLAEGIC